MDEIVAEHGEEELAQLGVHHQAGGVHLGAGAGLDPLAEQVWVAAHEGIALHVCDEGEDTLPGELVEGVGGLSRIEAGGEFHQQHAGILQAQVVQVVHLRQGGGVEHLGPQLEGDGQLLSFQCLSQALSGALAAFYEVLDRFLIHTEMGRQRDLRDVLAALHPEEGERVLRGLGPVIHAREDVGVEIGHDLLL